MTHVTAHPEQEEVCWKINESRKLKSYNFIKELLHTILFRKYNCCDMQYNPRMDCTGIVSKVLFSEFLCGGRSELEIVALSCMK